MIESGASLEYVAWAYAGVAAVLALLVAFVIIESRRVKTRLEALEQQGIARGSSREPSA